MKTAMILVTLSLVTGQEAKAPEGKSPEAKKPAMTKEQAQEKVRQTLNSTGSAVDSCIERYIVEQPAANGDASVNVAVGETGAISKTTIDTGLPGARNLRVCLEKVARQWSFPVPKEADQTFSLKIPIRKGVKFYIPAPGEKPKPTPAGEKREGFLTFLPGFQFKGAQE